jgi:hypothetical protein
MDKSPYRQAMTAIEGKLDLLAQSGTLPVPQAIQRAQEIAALVEKTAALLEEKGHFEEAADLYEKAAQAFQSAVGKVPDTEREQLYARADFWSAKADVTRYRVYTAPATPPVEQPTEPTTNHLPPKTRPKRRTPTNGAARPSTGAFSKGDKIRQSRLAEGAWTQTEPPSPTAESRSVAGTFEKPNDSQGKRQPAAPSTSSEEQPRRPTTGTPEVWRKKPRSE